MRMGGGCLWIFNLFWDILSEAILFVMLVCRQPQIIRGGGVSVREDIHCHLLLHTSGYNGRSSLCVKGCKIFGAEKPRKWENGL